MRTLFSFCLISLISSCNYNEGPYKQVEGYGLNDTSYYHYSPRDNKVGLVVKKKYTLKPYSLTINKDTLIVGEIFKAFMGVDNFDYEAVIESPTKSIISGKGKVASWDEPTLMDNYEFETNRLGLFEFKGYFKYDTLKVPFVYKFIVVEK